VAQHYRIDYKTLERQYKENLSCFREWQKKTNPEALVYVENFGERMSIDEVTLQNGELYTVLTNKDKHGKKGCLAALMKGTKSEVVNKVLKEVPVWVLMNVKEITADLANTMDWICRTNFMNAIITADRFHVQQVVSEAVQEIRIKYRREAIEEENFLIVEARKERRRYEPKRYTNGDTKKQLLARSMYLLFKPRSKWTKSQKERAEILFREYPEGKKAYDLSMYFRGIMERDSDRNKAKIEFKKWYEKVNISEITELIPAAHTIELHEGKILNYFYHRETNASAESFNAKLKGFRALLRGVRDIKFFLFRVETLFA